MCEERESDCFVQAREEVDRSSESKKETKLLGRRYIRPRGDQRS